MRKSRQSDDRPATTVIGLGDELHRLKAENHSGLKRSALDRHQSMTGSLESLHPTTADLQTRSRLDTPAPPSGLSAPALVVNEQLVHSWKS